MKPTVNERSDVKSFRNFPSFSDKGMLMFPDMLGIRIHSIKRESHIVICMYLSLDLHVHVHTFHCSSGWKDGARLLARFDIHIENKTGRTS